MEKRNYREYKTTSFWKEKDDDLIFFKYSPQLEINIDVAKEIVNSRLEYSENKPVYTLIDFTNVKSTTKEARDFMNSPEGGLKGILGGAFLSNSVVATLFINLYLKISKPVVPAHFFTDREEAINWLKKLKGERETIQSLSAHGN
jgi:hypothetical protein